MLVVASIPFLMNNFCRNFRLMVNSSCVIKLKLSLLIFSAFLAFLALTLWMSYRNLLCIFEFFSVLDTLKQFAQFLVELLFPWILFLSSLSFFLLSLLLLDSILSLNFVCFEDNIYIPLVVNDFLLGSLTSGIDFAVFLYVFATVFQASCGVMRSMWLWVSIWFNSIWKFFWVI